MSTAFIEDYSQDSTKNEKCEVLAQRSQILETVSRKAQERTLTLQETTDLYAKFNRTYESTIKSRVQKEDESWALKLLKECEEESTKNNFETRINGEPVVKKSAPKPTIKRPETKSQTPSIKPGKTYNNPYSLVTDEEKSTIRDLFIYDQFYADAKNKQGLSAHKSFLIAMSVSVAITLSGLIGIALFL